MVAIAPFRALRYNGLDLSIATSPPHDVVTDAERDAFIAAEPHNICNIVLPPDSMEAAGQRLEQWIADGTLVRDASPSLYYYEVRHGGPREDGTRAVMRGFYARIKIDPEYKEIRRHEKTLPKKRSTRLDLLRATNTNTESIWMLYRDERGWVDEILSSNATEELLRFTDEEGTEHRLWRVDRPEAVEEIRAQFSDRTVVIADGHHRYATQCNRFAETGKPEDASMMVCLVRDTDAGLAIRPTDRLMLDWKFATGAEAVKACEGDFEVRQLQLPQHAETAAKLAREAVVDRRTFVVLAADGAWVLKHMDESQINQGRGTVDELAVTVLHDHILTKHWGVDMEEVESHLTFTRSDTEAVEAVQSGEVPAAILLAPEPVAAVLDVASQGHVMPQKATYFVPKLRSGLLLSPCDEALPIRWGEEVADGGQADFKMPPLA
jgi:uncharacterized protein (DUF1015 family)